MMEQLREQRHDATEKADVFYRQYFLLHALGVYERRRRSRMGSPEEAFARSWS